MGYEDSVSQDDDKMGAEPPLRRRAAVDREGHISVLIVVRSFGFLALAHTHLRPFMVTTDEDSVGVVNEIHACGQDGAS